MSNRVKFHTIEQPDSDTTTYVASCNRLDLLEKTLESFFKTRDYLTKMIIVDDSAEPGVFETLVEKYGNIADIVCFPKNRGIRWSMDFMTSYCDTEYIFYLEDDWNFIKSGYLNESKKILSDHRDVGIVDLSGMSYEWNGIDSYDKNLIEGSFFYKKIWKISPTHYAWYGWCGSPNLKRREDMILLGRVEKFYTEWAIDRKFKGLGFKCVFSKERYVEHTGWECSMMEAKGHRKNQGMSPEDWYPKELEPNRTFPKFDYFLIEEEYKKQEE